MKLDGEEMGGMGWCYNSLVTGFIKKRNRKIRKTFIKKVMVGFSIASVVYIKSFFNS